MATEIAITSAAFSPNPASLGSTTKLSVTVIEIEQTPSELAPTSGQWTSGEV